MLIDGRAHERFFRTRAAYRKWEREMNRKYDGHIELSYFIVTHKHGTVKETRSKW